MLTKHPIKQLLSQMWWCNSTWLWCNNAFPNGLHYAVIHTNIVMIDSFSIKGDIPFVEW